MILRNLSPTGCGGKTSKQKKTLTQMYPAVKTHAYSFYVISLETTGKTSTLRFPRTVSRTNNSLGAVPGKSHSSQTRPRRGTQLSSEALPCLHIGFHCSSILLEPTFPNFGGFHGPTVIKIKHPA